MPIALLKSRVFKTLWAEDYGFGRGSGTPYVPPAASPLIVAGQVTLQSDDATWHRLRLATDEGVVRPDVEQTTVADPGGAYLAYLPMEGGDGNTYRVSFQQEEGVTHLFVDDTPRVETGFATVLLRNITDGLDYVCSLVIDEGVPRFSPAQTP